MFRVLHSYIDALDNSGLRDDQAPDEEDGSSDIVALPGYGDSVLAPSRVPGSSHPVLPGICKVIVHPIVCRTS